MKKKGRVTRMLDSLGSLVVPAKARYRTLPKHKQREEKGRKAFRKGREPLPVAKRIKQNARGSCIDVSLWT